MTTPPSQDPISQIYLSDTFYTWYKKTNDLITKVNPIEVYSITADTTHGSDGVTLSDDGDGNWTIGYDLPDNIPDGHTFEGDILFAAGVSGNIVNQYNGLTGNVSGVSTISNTYTPDGSGNLVSVPMVINGVTASTGGVLDLDASDIPNTIAGITGPAGYVIVSSGPTMDSVTQLFNTQPGETQEGLNINPATSRVVVGGNAYSSNHALRVDGRSGGIEIFTVTTEANSIDLDQSGAIKSDDSLYIMSGNGPGEKISFLSGANGATHGVCTEIVKINGDAGVAGTTCMEVGISDNNDHTAIQTHADYEEGGIDLAMNDRGALSSESSMNFLADGENYGKSGDAYGLAAFHFRYGDSYTNATTVLALNQHGSIGVKGPNTRPNFGTSGFILTSGGANGAAKWTDPDDAVDVGGGSILTHFSNGPKHFKRSSASIVSLDNTSSLIDDLLYSTYTFNQTIRTGQTSNNSVNPLTIGSGVLTGGGVPPNASHLILTVISDSAGTSNNNSTNIYYTDGSSHSNTKAHLLVGSRIVTTVDTEAANSGSGIIVPWSGGSITLYNEDNAGGTYKAVVMVEGYIVDSTSPAVGSSTNIVIHPSPIDVQSGGDGGIFGAGNFNVSNGASFNIDGLVSNEATAVILDIKGQSETTSSGTVVDFYVNAGTTKIEDSLLLAGRGNSPTGTPGSVNTGGQIIVPLVEGNRDLFFSSSITSNVTMSAVVVGYYEPGGGSGGSSNTTYVSSFNDFYYVIQTSQVYGSYNVSDGFASLNPQPNTTYYLTFPYHTDDINATGYPSFWCMGNNQILNNDAYNMNPYTVPQPPTGNIQLSDSVMQPHTDIKTNTMKLKLLVGDTVPTGVHIWMSHYQTYGSFGGYSLNGWYTWSDSP